MSTIITDNPYTFTVQDNMSIKAVFENSVGTLQGINTSGAYVQSSSGTMYINFNGTRVANAYSSGYGFSVNYDTTFPITFTGSGSVNIDCSNMYTSFFNTYKINVQWGGATKTTITSKTYVSVSLDIRSSYLTLNIVNK